MILFKLYLIALVELAVFNPEILDVEQAYKKNFYYFTRPWIEDKGKKNCLDNPHLWQTKIYNWDEVEDIDYCIYDLVIN